MTTVLIIIAIGLFFVAFILFIGFGALFRLIQMFEEELKANRYGPNNKNL